MEIDEGSFGKEEISMDVSPSSPFSDLGFFLFSVCVIGSKIRVFAN